MAVSLSLSSRALAVEPGSSGTVELTVRNDGPSAEQARVEVGGPARPFSFVVPDRLALDPGGSAAVKVGFRLPRTSLPRAGPLPFEVTVIGESERVRAEGELDVLPFSVLSATLDPPEAASSGPSRHRLCLGNRGNAPVRVDVSVRHGDELDATVDPASVVASPDDTTIAAVAVTPRRRRFTGDDRELGFTVVATPDTGAALEVAGRLVQKAAVATKTVVASGVTVGVAVLALVVATAVFGGHSSTRSSDSANSANPGGTTPAAESCPAEGHRDPKGISGLEPEDIPKLPNSFSFFAVRADGCFPIRFNPCDPVHYIQNAALAPPTGVGDVREAFRRLSEATGITFVDDGTTDEANRRGAYVPDRYPDRWAPILVTWAHFGDQGPDPTIQAVGRGVGLRPQGSDVLVSGVLSLNVDAVTDRDARTPVGGGFGPAIGSGTGAIGPKEVTWGRIILHELAHVVGLGHTRDKGSIMYPETAEQTARPSEYKEPDRQGLHYLGRDAGCLTTPPLPSG